MTTIGVPRRRRDGEAKVRGLTRFVSDMPLHGLLHARPVLAAEAHARILGIDKSTLYRKLKRYNLDTGGGA